MIVVDTSAIIAMMFAEAQQVRLLDRLVESPRDERFVSAATYIEAGTVIALRRTDPGKSIADLDEFLTDTGIEIVELTSEQAKIGLDARIRFGKGFGHRAQLNFGDSFSYALAKSLDAPLLFIGDDFTHTDIRSAL
jgi:ribonuclease VapC